MLRTPESIEGNSELPSLVVQLRAGCPVAFERIVNGHIQTAQRLAANWSKKLRAPLDETEAEAMWLLTLAVDKAKQRDMDEGISAFINYYVDRGLLHFGYKKRYIKADPEKLKKDKRGRTALLLQFAEGWLSPDFEDNLLVDQKQQQNATFDSMVDALNEIIETDEERLFVALRLRGHSNEEVAMEMGISYQSVGRLRRKLETRFMKEFFECESQSTSVPQLSSCIEAVEMTITSAISLTQRLLVTVKHNQ